MTPLYLDLRPAEQFAVSRIPGAVHLDLWGVSLIDTSEAPLRAFMWMIGHLFALRGVSPDRPVVVYESNSGLRAARALWFLEYFEHPDAQLLDGGFDVWEKEGGAVETGNPATPVASNWEPRLRSSEFGSEAAADRSSYGGQASKIATWRDVLGVLGDARTAIVDTRSDGEYYAENVRAKRGGAIPGAVHLEWTNNLASDGRFKTPDELRAMYAAVGVTSDQPVITYCQGGYRAAHTYLALRRAGFENVRNYTGSWKEWGDREDLPLERPTRR